MEHKATKKKKEIFKMKADKIMFYQFFASHTLHQSLKKVVGITLAEVEGFLNGCYNVSFHSIREAAVQE